MKINISENTASSIIKVLNDSLHSKMFDKNYASKLFHLKEDVELMIEASKALGELQGAINAVKDNEPKKKKNYRPCKTIKEFYEAVNNYGSDSFPNEDFTDENFIYNLLGTDIHFRSKSTYVEYYSTIVSICKKDSTGIRVLFRGKSYLSFEQIFTSYEIELEGKWKPFGVLDED